MPNIEQWVKMYSSTNHQVKIRAARVLLQRFEDIPLDLLIEILETLPREGLGADAEKALLKRRDAEIVPKMIALLQSEDMFVRDVACNVLRQFGEMTTWRRFLRMIRDIFSA